jgi:hypothetical protein
MPLVGNGLVAIWNDILDEKRDSFFEWHPREHMQERMGVPGFRRGRRYIAVEADIEFFHALRSERAGIARQRRLSSAACQSDEWSLSVLPSFRNNLRGVCRIESTAGYADGGFLATIRFEAAEGRDEGDVAAAVSGALAGLVETPRITGMHVARCDQQLSAGNQSLQRGRTISVPNLIVLGRDIDIKGRAGLRGRLRGNASASGRGECEGRNLQARISGDELRIAFVGCELVRNLRPASYEPCGEFVTGSTGDPLRCR